MAIVSINGRVEFSIKVEAKEKKIIIESDKENNAFISLGYNTDGSEPRIIACTTLTDVTISLYRENIKSGSLTIQKIETNNLKILFEGFIKLKVKDFVKDDLLTGKTLYVVGLGVNNTVWPPVECTTKSLHAQLKVNTK